MQNTNHISKTYRALSLAAFGGPENLGFATLAGLEPGPGEILVRIEAAGLNPVDVKTRAGGGIATMMPKPPLILGWDMAGKVVKIGSGVTGFAAGDAVFGMIGFPSKAGAYAEYALVKPEEIAPRPSRVNAILAAATPLAALTAWQALFEVAKLRAGMRLLVIGAAGGVGHFAVQIAKAMGVEVTGTTSARNQDFVLSLGAKSVMDYQSQSLEQIPGDFDAALNTVNPEWAQKAFGAVKPGGMVVSITGKAPLPEGFGDRRSESFLVKADSTALRKIAALMESGQVKPEVEKIYGWSDASSAHRHMESGHVRGKLVMRIDGLALGTEARQS